MTDVDQLRTVQQLAKELKRTGGFSVGQFRWLIFNGKTNGFDEVLVRVGRRVYIDRTLFNVWLDQQRTGQRAAA